MVGDAVGTFELHALVVVDVVAERILEIQIERQALPGQRGEDVTIKIGIRITNLHTIGFVDPTVAVLIDEMHIAGAEITRRLRSEAGGVLESCGFSLGGGGEHTGGFVTIEHAGCFSHGGEDVVFSVDRRGVTGKHAVAGRYLIAVGIESPSLQTVVGGEGERLDFVLIVTYAETKLPLEVRGIDKNSADADVGTAVGERAFVGPLSFETGNVANRAAGQQIVGLGIKDFCTKRKTIAEHVERQSHVEAIGGFPLDLRVLNVGELECCGAFQELHVAEVGTRGVIVYVIITGDFKTCGKFGIINGADFEPFFVGKHPSGLNRGEESPLHSGDFDSAVGFTTKTRRGFCTSDELEEVAVHVVVINVGVIAEVDPTVVDTAFADILQRIADVGHLVVVVVVTARVAVRIGIGRETETAISIELVLAEVAFPIDAEIIEKRCLLTKLRSGYTLHGTETFHRLFGRTIARHIVLFVAAVERVCEAIAYRPVVVDLVLGRDVEQELSLLLIVLVVTFAVLEDPIGIGQTGIAELRSKHQGIVRLIVIHTGVHTVIVYKSETVVAQIAHVVGIGVNER